MLKELRRLIKKLRGTAQKNFVSFSDGDQGQTDSRPIVYPTWSMNTAVTTNAISTDLGLLNSFTHEANVAVKEAKTKEDIRIEKKPVEVVAEIITEEPQMALANIKEQIKIVEQIIREVIAGVKEVSLKKEYVEILNDMFHRGAEGVILGCTELPLAVNYEALGNKTINSDEVLAEGLVDYYYQQ